MSNPAFPFSQVLAEAAAEASRIGERLDLSSVVSTFYENGKRRGDIYTTDDRWMLPVILHPSHVTTFSKNTPKDISLVDFKNMLDIISEDSSPPDPISLPYGCFMMSRAGDTITMNCYYPEVLTSIKYMARKTYKVPVPNVIMMFQLKVVGPHLWQVTAVKYFCTDRKVSQLRDGVMITDKDPANGVYGLPFSNMYDDCRMCFGGNTMPVRFSDNMRGLDYYYQIISIAPFNDDLGIRGLSQGHSPGAWYEKLSTYKEFPYDLLSKR